MTIVSMVMDNLSTRQKKNPQNVILKIFKTELSGSRSCDDSMTFYSLTFRSSCPILFKRLASLKYTLSVDPLAVDSFVLARRTTLQTRNAIVTHPRIRTITIVFYSVLSLSCVYFERRNVIAVRFFISESRMDRRSHCVREVRTNTGPYTK